MFLYENACARGHIEIVTWLLSEMKLSHDERASWLLATASACSDITPVRLLASQTGLTSIEPMSQALRVACYLGRVKNADWLMTHTSADVSLRGELDISTGPMMLLTAACFHGHVDTVAMLIKCVTPHTVNIQCGRHNDSALHFAICFSNVKNWKHSIHGACTRDNTDDVSIALYDTNVNMTCHDGSIPLHWACQNGSVDIVRLLLSVFARVDITNDDRRTPIDAAMQFGNKELVPYMSSLLDVTNYIPSSSTTANFGSASINSGIQAAVDVIVSDVSIVSGDVRSTVQPYAQRNATTHTQQQRKSAKIAGPTSNSNSGFKIV
jgi:hypothetical protein